MASRSYQERGDALHRCSCIAFRHHWLHFTLDGHLCSLAGNTTISPSDETNFIIPSDSTVRIQVTAATAATVAIVTALAAEASEEEEGEGEGEDEETEGGALLFDDGEGMGDGAALES